MVYWRCTSSVFPHPATWRVTCDYVSWQKCLSDPYAVSNVYFFSQGWPGTNPYIGFFHFFHNPLVNEIFQLFSLSFFQRLLVASLLGVWLVQHYPLADFVLPWQQMPYKTSLYSFTISAVADEIPVCFPRVSPRATKVLLMTLNYLPSPVFSRSFSTRIHFLYLSTKINLVWIEWLSSDKVNMNPLMMNSYLTLKRMGCFSVKHSVMQFSLLVS